MNRREFLQSVSAIALASASGALAAYTPASGGPYDVFLYPDGAGFGLHVVPWADLSRRSVSLIKTGEGAWVPSTPVGNKETVYAGSIYLDETRGAVTYDPHKRAQIPPSGGKKHVG